MNNIRIGKETLRITAERRYNAFGKDILLPDIDLRKVYVITPERGNELVRSIPADKKNDVLCRVTVINADSFQAGRKYENPLVMNFANAHNPGGGFRHGANAQEEALCRCSTLYESITSKEASEMYKYNNTHISKVESDYMLISPNVVVFRDEKYDFLEEPVTMGVLTAPAPNRYGAASLASDKLIEETFIRRIRIALAAAVEYGYKYLVLGAWGCGAFGNRPEDVAGYFKKVIVDEEYGKYFEEICFAIYGREDGKNITAFKTCFNV